ncbi:hypothetical protein Vretimale_7662 [Volvox reticuliferus]|uniref:Uncharacterized protein n=1 Tax=Volvox reticuliferus TaxID=1737510 RepID=A0A8J4CDY8_9CHLO|nr:hypothetical protein Vretifemale_7744 [Volvox reticuliferus]GIM02822.1 hypothetical protein Vretimale_7662 [Volvox reticuliferus]
METASVAKEATSVRPATIQSANSSVMSIAWREALRRAIHLLIQATARFRRLLGLLARLPRAALVATFHAPGSLAKLVRLLLSSRPARLLVAAVASIVCISLQYHRPTVADIQLSSSISLLFGMIKLQGALAVQLGPPESRRSAEPQAEELRINCPKDLKESIVRFLESQAAANLALQAPHPASQPSPAPNREELSQLPPSPPPPPAEQQQEPEHERHLEAERQLSLQGEDEGEGDNLGPIAPGGYFAFQTTAAPDLLAAAGGGHADSNAAADAAAEVMSYVSAGSGAGGFESCCSDTVSEAATAVACSGSNDLAAAVGVSTGSLASAEPLLLLPSTPPLGCSPPITAAVAAGCFEGGPQGLEGSCAGSQEQQQQQLSQPQALHDRAFLGALGTSHEPALQDRSDYVSLMSYAASHKQSIAVLGSPRAELATHGSSSGFDGIPFEKGLISLEGSEAEPGVVGKRMDAEEAADVRHGGGGSGGGALQKSPDSILGLRNLGLEGWAESSRRWESRYLDD